MNSRCQFNQLTTAFHGKRTPICPSRHFFFYRTSRPLRVYYCFLFARTQHRFVFLFCCVRVCVCAKVQRGFKKGKYPFSKASHTKPHDWPCSKRKPRTVLPMSSPPRLAAYEVGYQTCCFMVLLLTDLSKEGTAPHPNPNTRRRAVCVPCFRKRNLSPQFRTHRTLAPAPSQRLFRHLIRRISFSLFRKANPVFTQNRYRFTLGGGGFMGWWGRGRCKNKATVCPI